MKTNSESEELYNQIILKGSLKQKVYTNTYNTFHKFKSVIILNEIRFAKNHTPIRSKLSVIRV